MDDESTCNLIIIDNFYKDPYSVREFALSQEFHSDNYYPGKRTKSFANTSIKNRLEEIMKPYIKTITNFNYYGDNGSFQYTTAEDRSWIHCDKHFRWAAIVYLTPDAPPSSGTGFYKSNIDNSIVYSMNTDAIDSKDMSKWTLIDQVGNIFNRIVIFNSQRYHSSLEYFGKNKYSGRLFQVFFFD